MRGMEALKRINRTLLEMYMGMLFFGAVCQAAGALFAGNQGFYAKSLWFGIAMAMTASSHMYRTMERAMGSGEEAAGRIVTGGYYFRYAIAVIIFVIISVTKVMNPLVVFLGYMSLKVTAYLQPITHKVCNRLLHETDTAPEEDSGEDSGTREKNDSPDRL